MEATMTGGGAGKTLEVAARGMRGRSRLPVDAGESGAAGPRLARRGIRCIDPQIGRGSPRRECDFPGG